MAKSPNVWLPRLKASIERDRKSARRYFCSFTPKDKAAVPDLIEALESGDRVFGYWAARALSGVGPEATDAVPAIKAAVATTIPMCGSGRSRLCRPSVRKPNLPSRR